MAVFLLDDALRFPDPHLAEKDGLLAAGGDLRPERLLLAYSQGIFPWSSEGEPLLWWCPMPRMVLFPEELHIGRSLAKAIRRWKGELRLTFDRDFGGVMRGCAETPRPGQEGTWITAGLLASMGELHRRGVVHTVEAWVGDELVAGIYGLALGDVFCGESMFTRRPDASKVAFVALVRQLAAWGCTMIDCQQPTAHLRRFGAREIEIDDFLARLRVGVAAPKLRESWTFEPSFEAWL
ncbi:MAG TPA: leucyl/phenylalanyl-tRNA--protein transferase [Nannocystis exedens]|nr:leucyl/phenylalanyl-tRNA--protein transferase [Nannocystis exedens]